MWCTTANGTGKTSGHARRPGRAEDNVTPVAWRRVSDRGHSVHSVHCKGHSGHSGHHTPSPSGGGAIPLQARLSGREHDASTDGRGRRTGTPLSGEGDKESDVV